MRKVSHNFSAKPRNRRTTLFNVIKIADVFSKRGCRSPEGLSEGSWVPVFLVGFGVPRGQDLPLLCQLWCPAQGSGHRWCHGDISGPVGTSPAPRGHLQPRDPGTGGNFPDAEAERARNAADSNHRCHRKSPNRPPHPTPSISPIQRRHRETKGIFQERSLTFPSETGAALCCLSSLPLHYLQSSRSSRGAGNIIRLRRGAKLERRSATSRGAPHAGQPSSDRCRRLAASPRPPARPFVQPGGTTRRGAGMNPSLVSADDFTSLACS